MVVQYYWQCRVENCKNRGRSFYSSDAMWQHLVAKHDVRSENYENEGDWLAARLEWNDSEEEQEADGSDDADRHSVRLQPARDAAEGARSRSPRRGVHVPRTPPLSLGSGALDIANHVWQMDTFEFLSILRHMVDELETRLLRAEVVQRSQSQRSGRSSR